VPGDPNPSVGDGGRLDLEVRENGLVRLVFKTTLDRLAELNRRLAEEAMFRQMFLADPPAILARYGITADPVVFLRPL
jgi:hypothetical protein